MMAFLDSSINCPPKSCKDRSEKDWSRIPLIVIRYPEFPTISIPQDSETIPSGLWRQILTLLHKKAEIGSLWQNRIGKKNRLERNGKGKNASPVLR
jgi:hypothetical protein